MAATTDSRLTLIDCGPLGSTLQSYDRTQQQTIGNAAQKSAVQTFADAMFVREEVFVREQGVPLENELDSEDQHCVHTVLYHSSDTDGTLKPAGTIRVLAFDNRLPSHVDKHRTIQGDPYDGPLRSSQHSQGEAFITLGRLAIVKECRGRRWAELLVKHALEHASSNPLDFQRTTGDIVSASSWQGLVMIHAQTQAQKFWQRVGFEVDNAFGIWDEEGIDHVAMWTRVQLAIK